MYTIQQFGEIIPKVLAAYDQLKINVSFLTQLKAKLQSSPDLPSLSGNDLKLLLDDTELDFFAHEFCKFVDTTHIVIIWPKALAHSAYIIDEINKVGRVFYSRPVHLKNKALPYLVQNIPEKANNLPFHLAHYFNNESAGTILALLCTFPTLAEATRCKEAIRHDLNMYPPMNTLHVADTQEQSIMLAQIVFNANSIAYLNSSKPFPAFQKFNFLFDLYKKTMNSLSFAKDLFCVDGSSILAMYGLRDINVDFDFLSYFPDLEVPQTTYLLDNAKVGPLDVHNQAWIHAHTDPIETIFNPHYHFYYDGFKFTTLARIREFKCNQNRDVDQKDVAAIDALLKTLSTEA
jgi:hypothetical protein